HDRAQGRGRLPAGHQPAGPVRRSVRQLALRCGAVRLRRRERPRRAGLDPGQHAGTPGRPQRRSTHPGLLIPRRQTVMRPFRFIAVAVLLSGLAGCGGKYPVRGTVTYDDGTPVTKGLVIFERVGGGPPVTARGEIQPDGRYELSTDKPGDGVPA